jgi:hypothetical protein
VAPGIRLTPWLLGGGGVFHDAQGLDQDREKSVLVGSASLASILKPYPWTTEHFAPISEIRKLMVQ